MNPSPSLVEIQKRFSEQVQRQAPAPDETIFKGHVEAYAGGYPVRIYEGLAETYPAVEHLFGRKHFSELAQAYIRQFPSRDYDLSRVGRHLPRFLDGWDRFADWAFLPDLALLESRVMEAFHAREAEPLGSDAVQRLAKANAHSLRFEFQNAVSVVCSAWPILDLWQARATPREAIDIAVEGRPQHVIVHRHREQVLCRPADENQARLLEALLDGHTLAAAIDEFTDTLDLSAESLAAWFTEWVRLGLIVDIRIQTP